MHLTMEGRLLAMAEFNTAREVERWGNIAQSLIDNEPDRKAYYDATVKGAIAEMQLKMPNADIETLTVFTQSIAVLVLNLMDAKVSQVATTLDITFDTYAIATAVLLGAYEPGDEPVPDNATGAPHDGLTVPERETAPEDAPKRKGDPDVTYGLYL
jgi:hypothetical protein